MKVRYNFIIAIAAVMMLLLPGTQFFAASDKADKIMQSMSAKKYSKFMEQMVKLKKTTPDIRRIPTEQELEYDRYSMEYLLKLTLRGQKITELDNYESIKNFKIPSYSGVTKLSKDIDNIPNYFFAKSTKLRELCIPSNIKIIGKGAFFWVLSLEKVTIPESIKTIEKGAFFSCRCLREVELTEGLKSIGDRAFKNCEMLKKIEIPSSVESIASNAFENCYNLKCLAFKEGRKSINEYAFQSLNLEEIHIPSSMESCKLGSDCKKIVLMDKTKRVHKDITSKCSNLEEIILPDSVKYIDNNAFNGDKKLKNINLPENLLSIGSNSFKGCQSLSEVVIPYRVRKIGKSAFSDCSNLERVKIPKRFEKKLGDIFDNCKSLKEIVLYDENNVETQFPIEKISGKIKAKLIDGEDYTSNNVDDSVTTEEIDPETLLNEICELNNPTISLPDDMISNPTMENTNCTYNMNNLIAEPIEY